MSELFAQLGVNWKLLLAQAVNFLLLLTILRLTVYKPLLKLLKERRERIEKGLKDAEEAGMKLSEAEAEKRQKIKEAEEKSLGILAATEKKSKEYEAELLEKARAKETELIEKAQKQAEATTKEERKKFFEEAAGIVRHAIEKTVEAKSEGIDEELVKKVVAKLKESNAR